MVDHMNEQSRWMRSVYPWIVITISASFLVYKYILQIYPSVITNDLMKAFHIYGTGLGNLAATFFYSYLIVQLFSGILLDRYSPRLLSAGAIVVSAMGALVFANAHSIVVAEIARMMMGVGAAFATVSFMKIGAVWFRADQFALVSGLCASAAMLGALFGEVPLALINSYEGWRQVILFCAILGFVIAALFVLVIRERRSTDAISFDAANHRINLTTFKQVLYNKNNLILTFYSGLAFAPVAVFGGLWGNPFFVVSQQITTAQSAALVSFLFIGLAMGGPIIGVISDYLQQRRLMMFIGIIVSFISLSLVIYAGIQAKWLLALLLFLFGFGTGAFMLGFVVGKETNPVFLTASIVAVINTGDAIFGAVSEPLVGRFLDLGWQGKIVDGAHYFSLTDYRLSFLILPVYLIVAFCLLFFIGDTKLKSNHGKVKNWQPSA